MRKLFLLAPLALLLGAAAPASLPAGTYTNEEDRYFAGERGDPAQPDWLGIEVRQDGQWRSVDVFGKPLGEWRNAAIPGLSFADGGKLTVTGSKGMPTELRRGDPFTCWISVKRHAAKPDGSPDWLFQRGMLLHDQGGRIAVGGGTSGAPGVIFRVRDVVWPATSTNKPSLVLYVHRPDEPDKAVSYVWADPKADLIGINLRWVQGSCSREGAKP